MDGVSTKIDKLTAKNYTHWKIVMTSLLKSKGLWELCTVGIEVDEGDDAKALIEKMQKDEEAKHLIYVSIDANQLMATGVCDTAVELWNKVKENNEGAEITLRGSALADFLSFKYNKGESVIAYCGRYELALGRLLTTDYKADEQMKLWVFRGSLPKDVKHSIDTWVMTHPNGKVTELISQLKLQFHMDKSEGNREDTVALYTADTKKGSKPNNKPWAKSSTNKPQGSKPQGSNPQGSKPQGQQWQRKLQNAEIVCNYCKNKGHKWRECRKKKADDSRKKKFANNNRHNAEGGAFVAFAANTEMPLILNENGWIVDSGATSHMTAHRKFFKTYKQLDEPRLVVLGNGKRTAAQGEGTIQFRSGEYSGELHSVLWVPELAENLFSVGKAIAQGYEVNFSNNPSVVTFKKDGVTKLKGFKRDRGLFIIELTALSKKRKNDEQAFSGVPLETWHERFAHCSVDTVKQLMKKNAVNGLILQTNKDKCQDCVIGKICRAHHPLKNHIQASDTIAILHIDTCGPFATKSLGGSKYFVLAVEEFSDFKIIKFVRSKAEIPNLVKLIISEVEIKSRPVKMIVTDQGTEYVNRELDDWLADKGIIHDTTVSYTPQQNGKVERANRTLIEGIRTLLETCKFADRETVETLWAEAASTVAYTSNFTLSRRFPDKTKYELFHKKKPDVTHLRTFGERAIVRIPDPHRANKLSSKGEEVRFMGYTQRTNSYRFFSLKDNDIVTSCDAVFMPDKKSSKRQDSNNMEKVIHILNSRKENTLETNGSEPPEELDKLPDTSESDNTLNVENTEWTDDANPGGSYESNSLYGSAQSLVRSPSKDSVQSVLTEEEDEEEDEPTLTPPARATRSNKDMTNMSLRTLSKSCEKRLQRAEMALFTLDDEPLTIKDAKEREDWPKWKQAMDDEIQALNKNSTWKIVNRPYGIKPIKNKWVFKVKLDPSGQIERYKARLVAKGYTQVENIDYKETYAPVASMNTIRMFFAIANQHCMEIAQFDIKTAFLYGDLEEDIYMEQPEGYATSDNQVCKLIKSLYGLKQAPRNWNKKFDNFLQKFNLQQATVDKCLYFNKDRSLLLAIYVDDGLAAAKDKLELDKLIDYLKNRFELKTMPCEAYLGVQVKRDRKNRTLSLVQSHYVDKVLERFHMTDCKPASTPEEVGGKVEDSTPLTPEYQFKELVGSLLYLVTCTRPDIAHAVSMASRTSQPTQAHWMALKRILRYLKGSKDVGISFRWEKSTELVGYSDADYANDTETRRSTSGYVITYGGAPIAWRCQRQPIVTLSTTEAEYVSGCELAKELLPIREQLIELRQIDATKPTTVLIDNLSTVKIASNEGGQQRTKHIDVREKWLTEQVASRKLEVKHISGDQQAADILTKPLHKTKFLTNRNMIMTIAVLALLAGMVSCMKPVATGPLHFIDTNKPYFNADEEITARLKYVERCQVLFSGVVKPGETIHQIDAMIETCQAYHRKTFENIEGCEELKEPPKPMPPSTELHRVARSPVFAVASLAAKAWVATQVIGRGAFYLLGIGAAASIIKQATTPDEIVKDEATMKEKNDKIVESLLEFKQSLAPILDPEDNIKSQTRGMMPIAVTTKAKMHAWIKAYQDYYDKQKELLKDLSKQYKSHNKVTPLLNRLTDMPLWEEPAEKWSTMHWCKKWNEGNDSVIEINFVLPMIDHTMKIMEAISLNYWNIQKDDKGKSSLCWMKYSGPKHIIVNTTNQCMTDFTWDTGDESARAVSCEGPEDNRLSEVETWTPHHCSDHATLDKRHIQNKVIHGLHKIYCYPWNITIEGEHQPCPDHPFELEAKVNFKIANIEHKGFTRNIELISSAEAHLSKELAARMKSDYSSLSITAVNKTRLEASINNLVNNIRGLPSLTAMKAKGSALTKIFESPWKSIQELWNEAWNYVEHIGTIFGVIAILFILVLIMPAVQIAILILKVIGKCFTAWNRLINRTTAYLASAALPKKDQRRQYADKIRKAWDGGLQRRVLGAGGSVAMRMRGSDLTHPLLKTSHDYED